MKRKRKIGLAVIACAIFVVLHHGAVFADWELLGLKERQIRCLYYDSPDRLFAGTDRGLFLRWKGTWIRVEKGVPSLPINAIVKPVADKLVVAAGNGSRSDGLYIGTDVLDGPPFYEFELLDWIITPAELASRVISDTDSKGFRLFVSSDNSVFTGNVTETGIKLKEMRIPEYAFGVEMPFCAALHVFSTDQNCYAGGFDRSPLPGMGNLLRETSKDSMTVHRKRSNVTVITEGFIDRRVLSDPAHSSGDQLIYPNTYPTLVLGTTDEGVVYFQNNYEILQQKGFNVKPSRSWISLGSPSNESVVDILMVPRPVVIPVEQQEGSYYYGDKMYVAVPGGVYRKCDYNENCIWDEIGNLPERPLCLAHPGQSRENNLYAGTGNGVYLYTDATDTGKHNDFHAHRTAEQTPWFCRGGAPGESYEAYRLDGKRTHGITGNGILLIRPAASGKSHLLKAITVDMR